VIRVCIADDHSVLRRGLRGLIDGEEDMRVVAEAADGAALMEALAEHRPRVLVLDLSMPGSSGGALLTEILDRYPRLAVCIFSMSPEDPMALRLLRQGALGYLSKTRPPEDLLRAIRRVATGRRYLTDTLGELALDTPEGEQAPHARLSRRENQVFMLLIDGATVSEVANALDISPSTVSNHVAHVKTKLGANSKGEILRYAVRAGLLRGDG